MTFYFLVYILWKHRLWMEISHSQMRQPDPRRCSFFGRMIIRSRFTDHAAPFWLSQDLLSAIVHGMYGIEPWWFCIGYCILPGVLFALYILYSTKCRLQQCWALCSVSQAPTPPSEETSVAQFKGQRQFLKGSWSLKKKDENNLAGVGAGVMGVNRGGTNIVDFLI